MASQAANLWVLLGLGLAGILLMTKKLKRVVKADFGAFIERLQLLPPPPPAPPKAPHPLSGLTFAVSDVFDIEGLVTGFGNPDWARTHGPASQTSPVVSALVEGGATCIGKTVVDDMALGISGENKHHDTPTNPAALSKVPGGSSSGAAVAVAANLVDFSLGIDTVGGVRIPAGYCGVLGFRPSLGTVSQMGVVPVSPSLDTVGWFAKDPSILRRVGHVLLQSQFAPQRPRSITIAYDCFEFSNVSADWVTQAVVRSVEKLYGRQALRQQNLCDYLNSKIPSLKAFNAGKSNGEVKCSSLRLLGNAMQSLTRYEFKQNHDDWIKEVKPDLDPIVSAQLRQGQDASDSEIENWQAVRNEARAALSQLLKEDGILVIPTTADVSPNLGAKKTVLEEHQIRASTFTCLASMSGCCQVVVPLGLHEKNPLSVSLIARHGGDRFLLDTVQAMYAVLQEQADAAAKSKLPKHEDNKEASAEMAKEKGNQAYKERQWQRAIGYYTEAIKLNGKNATYYCNRAAAYLELQSFVQAEADCTKAIDLDKKNVKAYFRRGSAREMLGYYNDAYEDFRYANVLEPSNKRAAECAERIRKFFQ